MSDECIHGFSTGMCAICFPKPAAELPAAARSTSPARVAAPSRPTVRSLRAAARNQVSAAAPMSVLDQRIYHVTHIGNLPAMVSAAAILAGATPIVDIATPQLRSERAGYEVPGMSGATLVSFVPFLLSPDARLWQSLRDGTANIRLATSSAEPSGFVFLVSTIRQAVGEAAVFALADGSAEGSSTRFASNREDAERMLGRLRSHGSGETLLDAEFLLKDRLPLESVTLIGVANDKVRTAVRDILADSGFTPKVAVYPPWFQGPVDSVRS